MCVCCHVKFSATLWIIACQRLLSMEFSRQEYWSKQPFLSPGDVPNPGAKLRSPALQVDSLPSEPLEKPLHRACTGISTYPLYMQIDTYLLKVCILCNTVNARIPIVSLSYLALQSHPWHEVRSLKINDCISKQYAKQLSWFITSPI